MGDTLMGDWYLVCDMCGEAFGGEAVLTYAKAHEEECLDGHSGPVTYTVESESDAM